MIEISISQLSLKFALGNCQINIAIKCGEKKEIFSSQLSTNQKIIKYTQPQTFLFEIQNIKFIQFYIETPDDQGYVKFLGSSKFIIQEIIGKENSYKIDLEHGNIMNIVLRCTSEVRQSAKQMQTFIKQDISQTMSTIKSEPQINRKRYGSPQPSSKTQQSRSPQHKKQPPQPQPQPQIVIQQQPQLLQTTSSNLSKSSASSIKQQKILEDYKQYMQNSVLDESEEFQTQPELRQDTPQPIVEFKNSNIINNNINNINNHTPRQSSKSYDEISLNQYQQMVKQLSLLLDVQQDCDAIVYAVQQLLQKYRSQNEEFIRKTCDNQILMNQYTNLQQQKNLIETKTEEFKTQIKSKIKTYKNLFDENVYLKNQLKEELQKIVDLNIQIRELKGDQQEKQQIDSEIQTLKQQIDKVTQNVDQKQYDYAILTEEINLIQFNN